MEETTNSVIPEKIKRAMKIVEAEGYDDGNHRHALRQFFPDEAGLSGHHEYIKIENDGGCQYVTFVCVTSQSNVVDDFRDEKNWRILELKIHVSETADYEPSPERMAAQITIDEFLARDPKVSISDFFREVEARQRRRFSVWKSELGPP